MLEQGLENLRIQREAYVADRAMRRIERQRTGSIPQVDTSQEQILRAL